MAGTWVVEAHELHGITGHRVTGAPGIYALGGTCLVEDKVLSEIQRHPVPGLCHLTELEALMKSGHLTRVAMTDGEYAHYLSLVQAPLGHRLDVGESATLALAYSRSHGVVMDENKGRRYLAANFPSMAVVSSLTLFISATVRLERDRAFLRGLVDSARRTARMAVPKSERELLAKVLRR